jgi:hypothetical protein
MATPMWLHHLHPRLPWSMPAVRPEVSDPAHVCLQLLASPSEPLREQCVMGLGNIAADSAVSRDTLIALHAAPAIAAQARCASSRARWSCPGSQLSPTVFVTQVHAGCSVQMARNVAWALSNLCRRRASLEQVPPCLPFFSGSVCQRLSGRHLRRTEPHACRL